ncbi:MAG: signal peptidase I, partial [Microbacteriaceae bacterium]|nr:signal peptidase I [Microbacteriaceae bacterium]
MSTPTATAQKSRARRIVGHPLMHLLAAVIVLALLQTFVVKLFAVPSGSMEQTLEVGDRILVNRLADDPQPGDVVVFRTDEALWPSHSAPQQEGLWGAAKHAAKWFFGDILGFGPTTAHTMV